MKSEIQFIIILQNILDTLHYNKLLPKKVITFVYVQ